MFFAPEKLFIASYFLKKNAVPPKNGFFVYDVFIWNKTLLTSYCLLIKFFFTLTIYSVIFGYSPIPPLFLPNLTSILHFYCYYPQKIWPLAYFIGFWIQSEEQSKLYVSCHIPKFNIFWNTGWIIYTWSSITPLFWEIQK